MMSLTVEIRAILRRMAIAARRLVIDAKASHYPILEQDRLAFDPAETLSPHAPSGFYPFASPPAAAAGPIKKRLIRIATCRPNNAAFPAAR